MRPTEILMNEHRVIEQVLNCLEELANRATATGTVDVPAARMAIDFFQNFADRCHHGKEEEHLFPALEARGLPRHGGPTGVMLYEHDQGRLLIRGMILAADAAEAGQPSASRQFARQAYEYVQLLRNHIFKEDHRLFVMADRLLPTEEQQRIMDCFAHVEKEHMGEGTHEKYLALADDLAYRLHVPRSATVTHTGCGCGHGTH